MKRVIIVLGVLTFVSMAAVAMAADTATLTVRATVSQTCRFQGGPNPSLTLDFGALDPVAAPVVNTSTSIQFNCNGVAPTVTANNGNNFSGSRRMSDGAATPSFIPYSLTLTPAPNGTEGWGTPRTLTIDGQIAALAYQDFPAGAYTDSVTITLTP